MVAMSASAASRCVPPQSLACLATLPMASLGGQARRSYSSQTRCGNFCWFLNKTLRSHKQSVFKKLRFLLNTFSHLPLSVPVNEQRYPLPKVASQGVCVAFLNLWTPLRRTNKLQATASPHSKSISSRACGKEAGHGPSLVTPCYT